MQNKQCHYVKLAKWFWFRLHENRFLLLRCVWADTDWQIETVTVLWVQIVGCQSANQPWPICKPDILFSGQSSLPPLCLARLPLSSVSYHAHARVCVFSSFHLFLTSPAALICSTAVMTFPETSSLVVFLVFLLFFLTIICFRLWSVCKAFKDICVYTDMCVCVWSKYPPLGSLVRRGSGKCDDHLMFCEAPSLHIHRAVQHTDTHTDTHMLCWCCTTASRAALSLLRDCRLCFLSTEDSALSSTFPAFFYPSSPTLSLSISLPSPHHPYPWFFPLTFTSISPSFSLPPSFSSFIPTSETVAAALIGCSGRIREIDSQ